MASTKIQNLPLKAPIGAMKIPTGGFGDYSITVSSIGDFIIDTFNLATKDYVDNLLVEKEDRIDTTGGFLTPVSQNSSVPDTTNDVIDSVAQALLDRIEYVKDVFGNRPLHNELNGRSEINAHPSTSISHGSGTVFSKFSSLDSNLNNINNNLIPNINNNILLKEDKIVNGNNFTEEISFSPVPSTSSPLLNTSLQALANRDEFLNVQFNKGINPTFDQAFVDKIGGYPLNARLMLDNGDIVRSTIANNTANPNSDMTGWSIETKTLVDIDEMLNIASPKDGQVVNVSYYSKASGILTGGGTFIYDSSRSSINNGGTIINGWVRQIDGDKINVQWFGTKGDGIADDYQALYNCFNHHYNPEVGTTDPNALQHAIPSLTFYLPHGCYRYTQPLRLPCKGVIECEGVLNYFARPNVVNQKNRATLFYDGDNLEVAALYTPMFKYVNNSWVLISDSTEFFNYSSGIPTHSMARGCEYRFNLVTKRKTKIGFNAFGVESNKIEVAIGTIGSWASPQNQSSWGDYNPDDLSPKVGMVVTTAWNVVIFRPRILAHNQGLHFAGSTGSTAVHAGYINRQVSTAASSVTDGLVYGHSAIPATKQGLTAAITAIGSDISFYDTITEGWGCPNMFFGGRISQYSPHIEGPNDIMMHDWMVYNCKLDIYNWSALRTMQLRTGTSMIYTCGMDKATGNYVHLHDAPYYGDNSLFNLVDGVPYDQYTNAAFLKIENVPFYKAADGFYASDLRFIKSVSLQYEGVSKSPIYLDTSRQGMKSLGLGTTNAVQSLSDLVEVIRILGSDNWNGIVRLPKGLSIGSETTFNISTYVDSIEFNIDSGFSMNVSSRFKVNCRNVRFTGNGGLIATGPIIEPLGDTNVEIANATLTGSSAIIRTDSYNGYKHTIRFGSNVNGSAWDGRYVFSTASIVGFVDLLILGSRSDTVKSRETTNNNLQSAGAIVANKYFST